MDAQDEALEAFCRENYPRLVGLLGLYCGDPEVGEELAQEVMAITCQHWSKVRRMAAPTAWLHRVAINAANSFFRRKRVERLARERANGLATSGDYSIEGTADAIAVREAVSSLPKRQRSVVLLRYFADLNVQEVAIALDLPEGTVKSLSHRGIRALGATLTR